MPRLSVRTKLFGGFAIVLALLAVVAVVGYRQVSGVGQDARAIGSGSLPRLVLIKGIDGATMDYRGVQYAHVAAPPASRATFARQLRERRAEVRKSFARFARLVADPIDRRGLDEVARDWSRYLRSTRRATTAGTASAEALGALDAALPRYTAMQSAIDRWAADSTRDANATLAAATAKAGSAHTLIVVFSLIALALGAALAYLIARAVTSGVGQMMRASRGVAAGDVDQRIDVKSRDEIGETATAFEAMLAYLRRLAEAARRIAAGDLTVEVEPVSDRDVLGVAFSEMVASLRTMIADVSRAAATVGAASGEMASSAEETGRAVGEIVHAATDVAQGAERQVRAVESVRAATEQMAASSAQSAGAARDTAAAARRARELAGAGEAAADRATDAMGAVDASSAEARRAIAELGAKSAKIGGIVETIAAIAEQTNLLALNAAIEAARAGEQGRGFAVVAEEVRKLAEESQTAAGTIAALVGSIQAETDRVVQVVADGAERTSAGAETVAEAREAFTRISAQVEQVSAGIGEVASAAEQLSSTSALMAGEIGEVAAVAEQTSASSEEVTASTEETSASAQEIAATAQSLAGSAQELEALVARFTVTAR
jgi:methyl-accepting chemotaxis protein